MKITVYIISIETMKAIVAIAKIIFTHRPAGPESSCSPGKKDPDRYPESCI
jgi:hypothetical protein